MVKDSVTDSASACVPLFCPYHILKSSVIYYWTDGQEHGIYLSNTSWQFVNLQNVEYMFLSQKNKSLTNVVHTYYTMLHTVHVGERNFQRILVLHVSQSACNSTKCQRNTDTSSLLLDRPYSATKFLLGPFTLNIYHFHFQNLISIFLTVFCYILVILVWRTWSWMY